MLGGLYLMVCLLCRASPHKQLREEPLHRCRKVVAWGTYLTVDGGLDIEIMSL